MFTDFIYFFLFILYRLGYISVILTYKKVVSIDSDFWFTVKYISFLQSYSLLR